MSAPVVIAAALVGGAGAIARFLLDGAVSQRLRRDFPYGTLAVNVSGSFALGLLSGAAVAPDALAVAGTGFLGGYTTFSTWMLESHRLEEDGRRWHGGLNIGVSLFLGVTAAWAGRALGGVL